MPHYVFFVKNTDIRALDSISEQVELLKSGYQKIDFESEAADYTAAMKDLKQHHDANTEANKQFTGDITFSAIIESLLR
ncbi:hypothetical protein FH968_17755 [Buttiauxella sp. B2]|uniref:hypothetical protein n=1 Tax=Buttiauxella sp. B2 TaxID=2587812 RepID=UPI001122222B|nr:hypothetical protein [Buttiauxella sp. B2]TNV17902.1 hypothetical protein FH968_17755 [Buttiauxella sp. B2]